MEQPSEPQHSDNGSARLRVLEMIDEGVISAEEGLRLLQAFSAADTAADKVDQSTADADTLAGTAVLPLGETEIPLPGGATTSSPQPANAEAARATASQPGVAEVVEVAKPPLEEPAPASAPAASASPAALPADARKWQRWWMIPVWIGVAITVFGGLFMYLAMRSSGIGFWFVCASLPFILGLLVIVLAWGSRNAPWLHLRVQQPPGEKPEKIAFSMPLPVRPAAWFLRTFGRWIPTLKEHNLDEVILAVGDKTSPDNPLYIVVDEEETGEKVEIYIG